MSAMKVGFFCRVWMIIIVISLLLSNAFVTTDQGIAIAEIAGGEGSVALQGVTFSGRVISSEGQPIAGATVNVGGITAQTDSQGLFHLFVSPLDPEEPVLQIPGRYVMNIRKRGYGLLSKVYRRSVRNGLWVMTKATIVTIDPTVENVIQDTGTSSECTGTLSSQVDWSRYGHRQIPRLIDNDGRYLGEASDVVKNAVEFAENATNCNLGIRLRIPANALVDSQGNLVRGPVNVSLSTIDIFDPDSMPGDYSVNLSNGIGYMVTFGAGTIDVYDSNDQELQLQQGRTATLTIPIHWAQTEYRLQPLESAIPFLWYNEQDARWTEIGTAMLSEEEFGSAYSAEIEHFSTFNMDLIKTNPSCVRIDTSNMETDFRLEVIVPNGPGYGWEDTYIRTFTINASQENDHVIYNLPGNLDIVLRAYIVTLQGGVYKPKPIMDTLVVNTGPANQSDSPPTDYGECGTPIVLPEQPLGPALYGPVNSSGTFTLSWDYEWPNYVTSGRYHLQESNSAGGPYTTIEADIIANVGGGLEHIERTRTKSNVGPYWYKVLAEPDGAVPIESNKVRVMVTEYIVTDTPKILRVINDLQDVLGLNGAHLNGIISVRIGHMFDRNRLINDTTFKEHMYPGLSTTDVSETEVILPIQGSDNSYMDFDVSNVLLGSEDYYYVVVQNGWWDYFCFPPDYLFCHWEKNFTRVIWCDGVTETDKGAIVTISRPFFDPEVIRASDILPHGNWPGHPTCP